MESVQKVTEGFEILLTNKDKKKMAGYMQKLGFEDIAARFYKLNPETDRKVSNQLSNAVLLPIKKIEKKKIPWRNTGQMGFILKVTQRFPLPLFQYWVPARIY